MLKSPEHGLMELSSSVRSQEQARQVAKHPFSDAHLRAFRGLPGTGGRLDVFFGVATLFCGVTWGTRRNTAAVGSKPRTK